MKAAPLPENEADRLAALAGLQLLDTLPEERFDRITRVAARLFDVAIAAVSLVDAERQWFKSRVGVEASQIDRELSICNYTILRPETLVIADALADERFADSPLVAGGAQIRFYAGRPLATHDGLRVGTLCIMDTRPRQMGEADLDSLQALASWAETELNAVEMGDAVASLRAANRRLADQNQARGKLVSLITHEFRTALTGILAFSEMMRDEDFTLAEMREFAADINNDAGRLNAMIATLLETARAS